MIDVAALNDIEDPGSLGVDLNEQGFILVRQGDEVFAFKNSCPHRGIRLEWEPNKFLDFEKQFIQCSTHGALFTLQAGECVAGPCKGQKLQAVPAQVSEGRILIDAG